MKTYLKTYFKNFDFPLFVTYTLLCLFGLVMIYSASMVWAVKKLGTTPDYFFNRQLINLVLSFIAFFVVAAIPYQKYRIKKWYTVILMTAFILLVLVKIIGIAPGGSGAKSWINLGFMNLQPSEVAKLAFIIYFAAIFKRKEERNLLSSFKTGYLPPFIALSMAVLLILAEPDFGGAMLVLWIALSVVITSGIRFKTFAIFAVPATILGAIFVVLVVNFPQLFVSGKRVGRISAFLDPFEDAKGYGYQIINGYYAIGAGGLKGVGLGQSVQKLGYLPEPQTDFIVAIIAEELGIFGVTIVLGGLFFLIARIFVIGIRSTDSMARMICTGVATWIGLQTFVNIGGLSGIIPLTGVPLPFISYGGTSILLLSIALGVVANISRDVKSKHLKRKA
ncbi:putative lipid II flippase FtsW [Kurthia massiliensis]|uniref:putative lipid II flippase FtsW n=1 Tax=Kurthia massiliensis TaxID=1033739 RepID=UPI000288C567|nr:putative lipid II flippase FtsW [Kurthia massiliensis]